MKKYEAVFKGGFKYSFEATDPKAAIKLALGYRNKHRKGEHFKLIQIGL